tara:strand:+ start:4198 stop:4413 length:216 start_codon:yes stop_codon:yes gene_type:complete
MTKIEMTPERIHIQNTTFEKEYGEVIKYTDKYVVVKLFHSSKSNFPENTSFIRKFSKKTGKAFGMGLKILP